jgi:hypothetical protein
VLRKYILGILLLSVLVFAGGDGEGLDYDEPVETSCGDSGSIVDFTCNIMKTLLMLGPMIAVLAIVLGGITYVYASIFVTADQRGRYHTLATNLAVGGLILAVLVGGSGMIVQAGMKFLTAG